MLATKCIKTLTLNTGETIPQLGLGTWQSPEEECYEAVISALSSGYTHIDTARCYGNEAAVGRAIKDFLSQSKTLTRHDLFITTKIWCTEFEDPETALKESLQRLQLDYVNLYLIHWPIPMVGGEGLFPRYEDGRRKLVPFDKFNYIDTYKLMQPLVKKGYTKAIGISNFNIPKIQALLDDKDVTIVPAAIQCELHPYCPQTDLVEFCQSKGIVVEAYSPLGSSGAPLQQEPLIKKLAAKYNVSFACILVSWAIARGTVVLPKSVNADRIQANLKVIDLDKEDVSSISEIYKVTSKRIVYPDWGIDIFTSDARFE